MVTLLYFIPMFICITIASTIYINHFNAYDGVFIFVLAFVPIINILVLIFLAYLFITSHRNS